ncbi:hypothetical protein [Dactylosporangium sp. NPDC048998]|uniref:hypothetical protein n=1 Tax=Dactylosporangium sp. NPDC048998 TaxID=3363976 RepID=UPI0037177B74
MTSDIADMPSAAFWSATRPTSGGGANSGPALRHPGERMTTLTVLPPTMRRSVDPAVPAGRDLAACRRAGMGSP